MAIAQLTTFFVCRGRESIGFIGAALIALCGCSSEPEQASRNLSDPNDNGIGATEFTVADRHDPNSGVGSLEGRVVFLGDVPVPEIIEDQAAKKFGPIEDESLLVDKATRGLANVCITLLVDADSEFDELATKTGEQREKKSLVAKGGRFVPRVLTLRAGEPFTVHNPAEVAHNIHAMSVRNVGINVILRAGEMMECSFDEPERSPIYIVDGIHPWMIAYVWVTNHSCVAVTDEQGKFAIRNIPTGEHRFRFYHEKLDLSRATIDGSALVKGVLTTQINEGVNTLDAVTVKAD